MSSGVSLSDRVALLEITNLTILERLAAVETVHAAKLNCLDLYLEVLGGLVQSWISPVHAAVLKAGLLRAVENPTLSGLFDTQSEQMEAAILSEVQTMMSDFVERLAAREGELRSSGVVPETPTEKEG